MREVARACAYVEQDSAAQPAVPLDEACLACEHKAAHPVIDTVCEALVRVTV